MSRLAKLRKQTGDRLGAAIVTTYLVLGSYGILHTFSSHGALAGIVLTLLSVFTAFVPAAAAGLSYVAAALLPV